MISLLLMAILWAQPGPPASPASPGQSAPPADAYAPLALYDGQWRVTSPHTLAGVGKTDLIENHCARNGSWFVCHQSVNGKEQALLTFVPAEKPGSYYTQTVLPNGYSTGRGDLTIAGNTWTYLGKDIEDGKTTWYRTANTFTGNNHIHFEQAQSTDNEHWTVQNQGDEDRVSP